MADKRLNAILSYIKVHKTVKLRELCDLFPDFNEMTIRRDLNTLQSNGYIMRTRGGAVLKEEKLRQEQLFENRIDQNASAKSLIAKEALKYIHQNSTIYLDAGTTMLKIAQELEDMPLFVITNSPLVALELKDKHQIEVILTGGHLNKSCMSLSGPVSIASLNKINIDTAFMGATGLSEECGFSNALYAECELKKYVINQATNIIMLVDSMKIGYSAPYTFANFKNIDMLITDLELPASLHKAITTKKVQVIVTNQD